ncbi:MAG TPA: ATP-binding protein [Pyrinomonadaceae bacterium]|jgi:hypothetical protein
MQKASMQSYQVQFPVPYQEKIIETSMMLEVIGRTFKAHPGNSVWYGESRIGKTTTASYMTRKIEEAYDPLNPHAFRALHYEVGQVESWSGNEHKKGLKSLYYATIGKIDEGVYRHDPPEIIADQIVHALVRKNIQIIFVDEAGKLSLDAIDGMLMGYNKAKAIGHPLSFIFIGMEDLPVKVTQKPQVKGRINEWCYFEAYSFDEMTKFLARLHPHFEKLDLNEEKAREQFEYMYEMFGGYPGLTVPFLMKLDRYSQQDKAPITLKYLRAVHLRTLMDQEMSIKKSLEIYRGRPPKHFTRKSLQHPVSKSKSKNEEKQSSDKGSNAKKSK